MSFFNNIASFLPSSTTPQQLHSESNQTWQANLASTTPEPIIEEDGQSSAADEQLNSTSNSTQTVAPLPRGRGRPKKFTLNTPGRSLVKKKRISLKTMVKVNEASNMRRSRRKSKEDSVTPVPTSPKPGAQVPSEFWKEMIGHTEDEEPTNEDEDDDDGDVHDDGLVAAQWLREAAASVSQNGSNGKEKAPENGEDAEAPEDTAPEPVQIKRSRGRPKGRKQTTAFATSTTHQDGENGDGETSAVPKPATPGPEVNGSGRTSRVAGQASAERTAKAYTLTLDPILDSAYERTPDAAGEPVQKDGRGRRKGFTKAMFKANSKPARGRGRPKKRAFSETISTDSASEVENSSPPPSKRRGRPPNNYAEAEAGAEFGDSDQTPVAIDTSTPRKRGRPSKTSKPEEPKRRGRPAKSPAAVEITAAEGSKSQGGRPKKATDGTAGYASALTDIAKINSVDWNIRGFTITMKKSKFNRNGEEKALLEGEFEFAPVEEEENRDGFNSKIEANETEQVVRMKFRGELL
jgi:hypothetical protein